MRRRKSRAELWKLQLGTLGVQVHFAKSQVAASLWDYGEDGLATRSLAMSDAELARIRKIASRYRRPEKDRPAAFRPEPPDH